MKRKVRTRAPKNVLQEVRSLMHVAPSPGNGVEPLPPEPSKVEACLHERIKELICLHGINKLVFLSGDQLDEVLQGIVEILPEALLHSREAVATIRIADRHYASASSEELCQTMEEPIIVNEALRGCITVGYGLCVEGSKHLFLPEERLLLASVAEHVGLVLQRAQARQDLQRANRQLELERQALRESNAALRALTDRLVDEKRAIAETIRTNMNHTIAPILEGLRRELPPERNGWLPLLEAALRDLTSPFLQLLRRRLPELTPTEQAICLSIRAGLTSKQIATLRGVAPGTISRHRENIRRKLGLGHSGRNLASLLVSIDIPDAQQADPPSKGEQTRI